MVTEWTSGVAGSAAANRDPGTPTESGRCLFGAASTRLGRQGSARAVLGHTIERNQVEVADHSGYGTSTTVRPLIPSKSRALQVCTGSSFAIAIAAIIAS
jgi:hypothetical protein